MCRCIDSERYRIEYAGIRDGMVWIVAKEPGFRDCRRCACLGLCLAYLKKNLRPRRVIKEPESLLFFFLFFPLFFSYRTVPYRRWSKACVSRRPAYNPIYVQCESYFLPPQSRIIIFRFVSIMTVTTVSSCSLSEDRIFHRINWSLVYLNSIRWNEISISARSNGLVTIEFASIRTTKNDQTL